MIKQTSLFTLILLILIFSGCVKGDTSSQDNLIPDITGDAMRSVVASEGERLESLSRAWQRYTDDTEEGRNWRRFRASHFRTEVFQRALFAYRQINGNLPESETVQDIISELETESLIPFWPLDCETGEMIRIVNGEDLVNGYRDVFIDKAANGAFDYVLEYYRGSEPFSPYLDRRELSAGLDDFEMEIQYEDEQGNSHTQKLPEDPCQVFAQLVGTMFDYMMNEAFIVNSGKVPENLEELFAGRMTVNETGWHHPTGGVQDGESGDFEYGVDPFTNSYYKIWYDENNERVEMAYRFEKSEIAGDLIYDLGHPYAMVNYINLDELQVRIPLLTDEVFSE